MKYFLKEGVTLPKVSDSPTMWATANRQSMDRNGRVTVGEEGWARNNAQLKFPKLKNGI